MLKRSFDLLLAIFLLLLLAIPMLAISALITVFLGYPVLFKQTRTGYQGKLFTIYKFRTMRDATDHTGLILPDEKRLTSFGKLLRRLSLDELPQLFNIIIGNLSFIGPRPLLPEYLPLYSETQFRRHEVKPGITGWAQVKGRNAIEWDEKFELDVWYVDHHTLILDCKIMLLTFIQIFTGKGISQEGHVTMPKFTGSRSK